MKLYLTVKVIYTGTVAITGPLLLHAHLSLLLKIASN